MSQEAVELQPAEEEGGGEVVIFQNLTDSVEICETEVVPFGTDDVKQETEVEIETDTCIEVEEEEVDEDDMTYEGICNEFVNEELCETVHSDEEVVEDEEEEEIEAEEHEEIETLEEEGDEEEEEDEEPKEKFEFVEILEDDEPTKEYSCGCKQLSTPTATYTCDICDEKNTTEYIIQTQPKVEANKNYVCTYCNKSFNSNSLFTKHINAHLGKKIYVCKFCNELFTSHVAFLKHVSQHANEEEEMAEDGE